jgi:hypothetical protein
MRNRTILRAASRKIRRERHLLHPFTGVMCNECESYARIVAINKSRGGGTQVICNSDNRHRR